MKHVIGITLGDPAGVGPEVIVKALASRKWVGKYTPLVIGSTTVLKETAKKLSIELPLEVHNNFVNIPHSPNCIHVLDHLDSPLTYCVGETNKVCGDHSFEYVVTGTNLCLQQKIDAIVTAPICKESWHQAGHKYDGHTGLLAALTKTKDYRMMFVSEHLNVVLVTTHIPFNEVCASLSSENIYKTIKLGHQNIKRITPHPVRIAVCGLNPHAGESGIFGNEEEKFISPAIHEAQEAGYNVTGPFPADTIFLQAVKKKYDLVVALYHDQGLIPVKLLYFDSAVNITVGLPIIRTSVDHGTAFDIAGKGIADETNMNHALEYAHRLVCNNSSTFKH